MPRKVHVERHSQKTVALQGFPPGTLRRSWLDDKVALPITTWGSDLQRRPHRIIR